MRTGVIQSNIVALAAIIGIPSCAAFAQDSTGETVPNYLEIVVNEGQEQDAKDVASDNILELDTAMKAVYAKSLAAAKKHFRERVPIIFALFNETGGQYVLWMPGKDPIVADPVPELYSWCKSVSHSTLAVYEVVAPYLMNPGSGAWRGPLSAYMARLKTALATLEDLDVPDDVRKRFRAIMNHEIEFIDKTLATGEISVESITAFAREAEPLIAENIMDAARVQVDHWESVLKKWKAMLGPDWDRTYAVTNTLYVTRRNNIHFTILANIMGTDAINTRLLLIESSGFQTTIDSLFDVLTRIVADRAVGEIFFKDPYVMDSELISMGTRAAIKAAACPQYPVKLAPLAPLENHQWPWISTPGEGPTGLRDLGEGPKKK